MLEGSAMHRWLTVWLGLALAAGGALVVAFGQHADWPRLTLLGGIGLVVGLLLGALGLRARGDRVVLHEHGFVRRSASMGIKAVRFDAITALRPRPIGAPTLGAIEITAGETFVVIDRSHVGDLESFAATLESRSGQRIA